MWKETPEHVIELGHVLGQGMRRHGFKVSIDRRTASQAAVGHVYIELRDAAGAGVDTLPAQPHK